MHTVSRNTTDTTVLADIPVLSSVSSLRPLQQSRPGKLPGRLALPWAKSLVCCNQLANKAPPWPLQFTESYKPNNNLSPNESQSHRFEEIHPPTI